MLNLSVEERDQILTSFNKEQLNFINERMTRGRRTSFARVMASQKGALIPEDISYEDIEALVDDWVYLQYTDAGCVSDDLKCECGRSLRYQHTVQNKSNREVIKFGIDHLELHTGIDAKIVTRITKGFDALDLELNEILYKFRTGWSLDKSVGLIPHDFQFPDDMQLHLTLNLPLLDAQIIRLRRMIRRHIDLAPINFGGVTDTRLGTYERRAKNEEGNQAAFRFFYEAAATTQDRRKTVTSTVATPLELALFLKEPVLKCLQAGMKSARIICEVLISSHGASDKRFTSGKPDIFVPVCVYIDELVAAGKCREMSMDEIDRIYHWIG